MTSPPDAARMRLRLRVHHVSRSAQLRRVITMAAPLRNTHITNVLWQHTGALISSRADLLRLGALFRLAAVSPHSAVFLPLRMNEPSDTAASWRDSQGLADLLIVRRDVPLRPSAWPTIRATLRRGPGAPATMSAPAPRPPAGPTYNPALQALFVAEHAHTLVMSGTSTALHEAGDELTWCGNEVATNEGIHRYGGPTGLSQFNGPDRRSGRRDGSWECMVLAEDPIFHRSRWLRIMSEPAAA
ncbi:hypothetical protein [Micromonospora sp. NPDC049204]|uniref:hypothetical protein n=1 Tax=Micromonospora sp. NPDC049204 TaxID=3154351 RepID=UPI0033DCADFF